MNLLILEESQRLGDSDRFELLTRQHQHVMSTLKLGRKDTLTVGLLNGKIGRARLLEQTSERCEIAIDALEQSAPPPLPIEIILGLPRPRMLQRILQTAATMGVRKLHLIQTSRVEKSYWQTPLLRPQAIHESLILGLEQGRATYLPAIEFHQRFRPFAEDVLPALAAEFPSRIVAHPGPYPALASPGVSPVLAAIGPEGGFLDKECERFQDLGFAPMTLGERILKVETALPVMLAKLF